MKKKYGEFQDNGWEYHIFTPDLSYPWFNYLFNNRYHSIISHTGGGFSYAIDPKVNRILRYDNLETDLPGRYIFIKLNDEIWSANWQPFKVPLDKWLTIFGPGYAIIKSEKHNINSEITYFVPIDDTIEIWNIKLTNKSNSTKKFYIYPFIELVAGDIDYEVRYRNIMKLYNRAEYYKKRKCLIFKKMPHPARELDNFVFFMTNENFESFETNKLNFYGVFRTIETCEGLKKKRLSNSLAYGEDMVGCFQIPIKLKAGESKEVEIILGFGEKREEIEKIADKYFNKVSENFLKVKEYWRNELRKLWIETGEEEIDRMINIWGKYQLLGITRWRGTSAYHGSEGGLGFRDLAQDVEGISNLQPELAKEKLYQLLKFQYSSGHAVSGFSVIEGAWDKNSEAKLLSGKSDVAVWLPNAVVKYVKETGDFNFLNEKVPYLDAGEDTVYNHIIKAVEYLSKEVGEHNLPLIKIADWNDAFDRVGIKGKGESIWLAEAVCWACLIVKELAKFLNDNETVYKMENIFNNMKENINKYGWAGTHYIAAFNDYGEKIGEKEIFLNSQTWAIIGRVYDENNLKKILKSIDSLDTPYGNLLFKPAYNKYNKRIGRVTAFAIGTKENAAVFSHAVAFKIVADCIVNRSDKAYQSIKKLLPYSKAKSNLDNYKVEPYVWAEYVIGKGNKNYGQGAFTWNTGTSVWTYIGLTEHIIGLKPDFDGLIIEPKLPKKIKTVKIKRFFRGSFYEIEIIRSKKEKKLIIDGKEFEGNKIPVFKDNGTHIVKYYF